jgi:hypothetical protein
MAMQAQPTTQSTKSTKSKVNSTNYNESKAESELISHSLAKIEDKTSEPPSTDPRRELIAVTAYYLAEKRGFESGHDLEDWMSAEAIVSADLGPARRTDVDR